MPIQTLECSEHGCIKRLFSKGLCHSHYDLQRKASMPRCEHDGCDLPSCTKGLCSKHYQRKLLLEREPCKIDGCGRPIHANGLCTAHHTRLRRHGHLDSTRPSDWGSKEKHPLHNVYGWMLKKRGTVFIEQEWLDDFWSFVKDVGEKPEPGCRFFLNDTAKGYKKGNTFWKKPVLGKLQAESQKEYQSRYTKKMRADNPERYAAYAYKSKYGVTLDQYNEMFDKQGGVCAICRNPEKAVDKRTLSPRRLAVDHCHKTGVVRGLLCNSCNTTLGCVKDSTDILLKAIEYLDKHG